MISDLQHKRIIFVTGKGGVGKSTIVSSMGIMFNRMARKPLIVEFSPDKSIEHIFNIKADTYREVEIEKNLLYFRISSAEALREYMKRQLIIDALSRFVMNTKFYRYFSDTAPGLKELVLVGKLYDLERKRDDSGDYLYDPIIVDAPQLGKFIPFIKTPDTVIRMFRIGPVKKEAEKVNSLVSSDKCAVIIVTTPDKMSISEALEAKQAIKQLSHTELKMVIINRTLSLMVQNMDINYYKQRLDDIIDNKADKVSISNALEKLLKSISIEYANIKELKEDLHDIATVSLPLTDTDSGKLKIAESLFDYLSMDNAFEKK
ncbi:MAG: hypothetical protein M1381_05855 [Deltaproteobacteria bacterium]|nr:hypothetical protein [Deltaproteobacteria bacterium]MCL5791760.1 hypothetical protein [Deltaproteobacteria bacterium]